MVLVVSLRLTRTVGGLSLRWSSSDGGSGLLCCPSLADLAETFSTLLWRLGQSLPVPESERGDSWINSGDVGESELEVEIELAAESASAPISAGIA